MFMDRQELSYAFKFIKGEYSIRKSQKILGMTIFMSAIIFNIIMSSLSVFLYDYTSLEIISYQDFSGTALFGIVIFPSILFIFTYRKSMNSSMIFPQTNNTRFIKDLYVSFYGIGIILSGYLFHYFFSFGFANFLTLFRPEAYVISSINILYLLTTCFSIIMYGLLAISLSIFIGSVIRKIKLFSLLFSLIPIICLSINFNGTLALTLKKIQFYIFEGSMIMFAVKILVTVIILIILAYIINNITPVENNVKYKSPVFIAVCAVFVTAVSFGALLYANTLDTSDAYSYFSLEEDLSSYSEELDKIEIDVSHLEEGTVLNLNFAGVYNDNNYVYVEHQMEFINAEELVVSGDTMTIFYKFTQCESDLDVDLSKYLNESFDVYLEGDTLYMNYDITQGVQLLNIIPSFLITQFDMFEDDNISISNYNYIRSAYCAVEFE